MKTFIASTLAAAALAQFDFDLGDFEDAFDEALDTASDAASDLANLEWVAGEMTTVSTVAATDKFRSGSVTYHNTCYGWTCYFVADHSGGIVEGTTGFSTSGKFYFAMEADADLAAWSLEVKTA